MFFVFKGYTIIGDSIVLIFPVSFFYKTADRNHAVYLNHPEPQLNVWVKPIDANGADRLSDLAVIV